MVDHPGADWIMMRGHSHHDPGGRALIQGRLTAVAVVAWLCVSVLTASPVGAEWFADIFVGASKPTSEDVKIREISPGLDLRYKDVDFDTSITYGGRFGKYFDGLPWLGVSADVMSFSPNISQQTSVQHASTGTVAATTLPPIDLSSTVVSIDLMLRLPLLSTTDIPHGRLQPYVLGGPAFFFTDARDRGNFLPRHQSELDVAAGYNVGGGVAWQFDKTLGIFGEYRYSHVNHEFDFHNFGARVPVETDLNTHHILIGISAKF